MHYYRQLVTDAFREKETDTGLRNVRMRLQMRKEPFAGWYCPLPFSSFIHFMWIVAYILLQQLHFYFISYISSSSSFCCSDWLDNDFLFSARIFFCIFFFPFAHRFQANRYCECATDFVSSSLPHTPRTTIDWWCGFCYTRLIALTARTAGCRRHVRFDAIVLPTFRTFFNSSPRTKENYLRRNSHLDFHMMSTKNNNYHSNAASITMACRRENVVIKANGFSFCRTIRMLCWLVVTNISYSSTDSKETLLRLSVFQHFGHWSRALIVAFNYFRKF